MRTREQFVLLSERIDRSDQSLSRASMSANSFMKSHSVQGHASCKREWRQRLCCRKSKVLAKSIYSARHVEETRESGISVCTFQEVLSECGQTVFLNGSSVSDLVDMEFLVNRKVATLCCDRG